VKKRLDITLVERGLAASRTQAQALVMEGKVRVAGQTEYKPSRQVDDAFAVEVEAPPRFVSRGGEKLEGAFELWGTGNGEPGTGSLLSAEGKVCIDVGSSTGGFTDCLLQHGAAKVMAVDVGTNQLAYKLRTDPRVWVKENFNARFMKPEDLPEAPALAVTDVSFISLKLILPPIRGVLAPGGTIVALIKPQFEVGKGNAPGGLVRDEALRLAARDEIVRFAMDELGLELLGLAESPVRGREMGNIEYLSFWRKPVGEG
jgi:23S rRNA (cytidine1920-2'-O)/16S rRNA (cytidine1409-2'-O)-methyltransferase